MEQTAPSHLSKHWMTYAVGAAMAATAAALVIPRLLADRAIASAEKELAAGHPAIAMDWVDPFRYPLARTETGCKALLKIYQAAAEPSRLRWLDEACAQRYALVSTPPKPESQPLQAVTTPLPPETKPSETPARAASNPPRSETREEVALRGNSASSPNLGFSVTKNEVVSRPPAVVPTQENEAHHPRPKSEMTDLQQSIKKVEPQAGPTHVPDAPSELSDASFDKLRRSGMPSEKIALGTSFNAILHAPNDVQNVSRALKAIIPIPDKTESLCMAADRAVGASIRQDPQIRTLLAQLAASKCKHVEPPLQPAMTK